MSVHVLITRHAEQDIRVIHEWINDRSPTGANRWLKALNEVIAQLPKDAECSVKAPEADYIGVDLRQRLFKTRRGHVYRIVFVIRVDSIRLLAVRGAAGSVATGRHRDRWMNSSRKNDAEQFEIELPASRTMVPSVGNVH